MGAFHKHDFYLTPFSPGEIGAAFDSLKSWFDLEKRLFPWRGIPTPYEVWVSEMMLQQTRAVVVIPYFERWMRRFPTIESLAIGSLDEVIKLWEGLGYYSRARSLWEGARTIVEEHLGIIPQKFEELLNLKGIGPYTAGAICSFAFHQREAAVDGNVARVLARFFCIEGDVDSVDGRRMLRDLLLHILPTQDPWVAMEALIELGALVCGRSPKCSICPMQSTCRAYKLGREEELPKKKKKAPPTLLEREVFVICSKEGVLVKREEEGKVMGGLFAFPYFDRASLPFEKFYPSGGKLKRELSPLVHTFTRYKATLFPSIWEVETAAELAGYSWVGWGKLRGLPFSSGHRKILNELEERN